MIIFYRVLIMFIVILGVQSTASAATFRPSSGINLDIWVTWPDEKEWHKRDVMLPFPQWRQFLSQDDLNALKTMGFEMVRLPVDPSPFLSDKTLEFRAQLYDSVLQSVHMLNQAGLKVIVDLHAMTAGSNRKIGSTQILHDQAVFENYLDVVRKMAKTIKHEDPSLVALELINEPTDDCTGAPARRWQMKLQRLFSAARSSALDTTLILSGACWGTGEGLAAVDPTKIPDNNIIWSFHSYVPFILTHQGATWAGDVAPHIQDLPYPPVSIDSEQGQAIIKKIEENVRTNAKPARQQSIINYIKQEWAKIDTPQKINAAMAKPFNIVSQWAKRYNINTENIMLGEFGIIAREYGTDFSVPGPTRAAFVRDMIMLAQQHGFSWAIWSYGGAFGIVESFDSKPSPGHVIAMIKNILGK